MLMKAAIVLNLYRMRLWTIYLHSLPGNTIAKKENSKQGAANLAHSLP